MNQEQAVTEIIHAFGKIFDVAKAEKLTCEKCGHIGHSEDFQILKNGAIPVCNDCHEQSLCDGGCGRHKDYDSKEWNRDGDGGRYCDECFGGEMEARESSRKNHEVNQRYFDRHGSL